VSYQVCELAKAAPQHAVLFAPTDARVSRSYRKKKAAAKRKVKKKKPK